MKKSLAVWPIGHNNQNLKEIRALGSEKIAPRTDGRTEKTTDKSPIPWPLLTESSRANYMAKKPNYKKNFA